MGASGWYYTRPYDPDPELALRRLHDEEFESGDYLPRGGLFRIPRDRDLSPDTPIKFRLSLYVFRMIAAISVAIHIHWFTRGGITPRSVDELLYIAGENGTHSILHITHASDIIELGVTAPLSKHRLLKHFGTTTPTQAQLDQVLASGDGRPGDDLRRWQGVYFAIHDEAGKPRDYMFIGSSGD
ncbi:hypothetical protein [Singulisphaera sp. PoT]|uniref:hypothetical protein n=1 Tax=Singulisphaera sp. PoT TaxID=3411797 RepID=UPI003BF50A28